MPTFNAIVLPFIGALFGANSNNGTVLVRKMHCTAA
jgi:hypothetical protein